MNDADCLRLAYREAMKYSDDPRTQNGAILIAKDDSLIATGANCFPDGVRKNKDRLNDRALKYNFMEHAERNVIYRAASIGISTKGATLYCPWFACTNCARAIIQSGISVVVGHKQIFDKKRSNDKVTKWSDSISTAGSMLREAGIETRLFDGKIGEVKIMFDGKEFEP